MLSKSQSFGPIFVSFDDASDPPEGFLDRFSDLRVILKPASEYYHALATGHREDTSVITTTIYRWIGSSQAEVGYLEYRVSMDRPPHRAIVLWKDGEWQIQNKPKRHRSTISDSST
jgi:hypothetical protein